MYHPPPANLPAFPDARRVRPKTPVKGGGGLRKRWKTDDGTIIEWDYAHGTVELYDENGRHLGEYNPQTGQELAPPDPTRQVET